MKNKKQEYVDYKEFNWYYEQKIPFSQTNALEELKMPYNSQFNMNQTKSVNYDQTYEPRSFNTLSK